jgi:hypothetical protein
MDKAKDAIAARAKREAAILLGVDIEHLSAADSLRVDMVSALRLVIDHEQGSVLSGGQADLGKLNVAVASLIALLPGRELPEPVAADGGPNDPRTIMWETYSEMRRRGALAGEGLDGLKLTVERLKAENEQLKAALAGAPTPDEPGAKNLAVGANNLAVAGNVVPMRPSPTAENSAKSAEKSASAAPPPPAPPRACRIGETWSPERGYQPIPPRPTPPPPAAASTPRTAAPAPSFNYDDAMRYVRPDGSISPMPLGGGGRKYWGDV